MSEDKEKIESLIELEKRVQAILADINNLKNKDTGKNYESLIKKSKELEGKLKEKTREFDELQEKFQLVNQELLEIKQEKMFFENYSKLGEDEKEKAKQEHDQMKEKYEKERQQTLESEQEKMFLEASLKVEEKEKANATKKYYKAIIFSVVVIAVIAGAYSVMFAEIAGQQYQVQMEPKTSGYTIQNLKGDKITTWLSWKLAEGDTLHVNILNSENSGIEISKIVAS